MTNLRLDLERMDEKIEEILTQIESASCNVTQGYKVYKELKDLRVMRRQKDKELQCLEEMVSCFDCSSMEQAFRYSVGVITGIMAPAEEKETEETEEIAV